jgi:hypothetical protein
MAPDQKLPDENAHWGSNEQQAWSLQASGSEE